MKKLLPLFAIAALLISIAALFISGDSQQQPNAVDANAALQEELNERNNAAADTPIEAIIERVAAAENEVRVISNAGATDHIEGDPAYLKFRVVDEHGNPIPECLVSFTRKPNHFFRQYNTGRRLDYKLESDASVMFAVTPNQEDYLLIYHPQWLDNRFACQTPTPNEIKDLGDIVMKPAATVTGTVLDEQGQPLANASVLALVSLPGRYDREQTEGAAVTGDDGAFLIGNLDINAYIIRVQAGGYDALEQTVHCEKTPGQQTVTAHMQRGSKITGRVLSSSGTPIVGAEIFNTLHKPRRSNGELFESPETTTASDGSYSAVIGKSKGKLVVTAQHPDYVDGQVEVDGYQAPDIILKSSLHMNGKVTNIVGLGKGGAYIFLRTEDNGEYAYGDIKEDGTFAIEDITPGVYNLEATTNLGIVKIENIDLMHSIEGFVVEMPLGPRLNFLVSDADGLPLPDVGIKLELIPYSYSDDAYQCHAPEGGHAIMGGMPYGKYAMSVEKHGYATLHQTIDVWQENEDVNIVLHKEASLSVDTIDANNNPVSRIDARLFKDGEMVVHRTTSDEGTIYFKELPAGDYQLAIDVNELPEGIWISRRDEVPEIIDDFGALKLLDITLIASEHESVVITIDGLCELEVSVVSDGQPVKDIRVDMEPVFDTTGLSSWSTMSGGDDGGQRTNAQGLVVYSNIAEGEYIITAKKHGADLDVILLTKVVNESNTVTIDLSYSAIEGTVVDDYGQVIANCEIRLARSLGRDTGRHRSREADSMTATSDANGFFSFKNVPSGIWSFVLVKDGSYSAKETLTLLNGENKNVGEVILHLEGSISGNNFRQPENIDYSAAMDDLGMGWFSENEYDENKVAEFEETYCATLHRISENGELDRQGIDWPDSDDIEYAFTRVTAGTYVIMFDEYSSQPITVKPGEDVIFNIPAE